VTSSATTPCSSQERANGSRSPTNHRAGQTTPRAACAPAGFWPRIPAGCSTCRMCWACAAWRPDSGQTSCLCDGSSLRSHFMPRASAGWCGEQTSPLRRSSRLANRSPSVRKDSSLRSIFGRSAPLHGIKRPSRPKRPRLSERASTPRLECSRLIRPLRQPSTSEPHAKPSVQASVAALSRHRSHRQR